MQQVMWTAIANSLTVLEGNRSLAVFIMLVIGLVVTMGIGSSFATVPLLLHSLFRLHKA